MSRNHDQHQLLHELSCLGDESLPGEASDADIVAGALAGHAAPSFLMDEATASLRAPVPAPTDRPSRPALAVVVAGITLAAAAAAVLLIGLPSLDAWRERDRDAASLAPAVHDRTDLREASERTPPEERRARRATHEAIAPEPEPVPEETSGALDDAQIEDEPIEEETGGADDEPARRRIAALPRTADALLSHAQDQLRDGKTRAAMRTYKRLVERFPRSREAKAALVSMGRIALQHGQAKQALQHFDAYLAASAGPLVEEARYGRIRALRKLGRSTQELRSIEAFLADHGNSIYAPRLKKRAEELRAE
jgi:tetratricopeptide (TPR) repeat protein